MELTSVARYQHMLNRTTMFILIGCSSAPLRFLSTNVRSLGVLVSLQYMHLHVLDYQSLLWPFSASPRDSLFHSAPESNEGAG
jgi:hypothetical protein